MHWIKLSFFHILIFIIFYYYFLSPIRIEISDKLLTEKHLKQEVLKKQKYVNKNKFHHVAHLTHLNTGALIKYFVNKISASKLLIEEINPIQMQTRGNLIKISFKVTLVGNIFQFKNLIDQLNEDQFLINIDEMIVKNVKKSNIKMIMKIDVFNIGDTEPMVFSSHPSILQWIGYIEKNNTMKALLRLEEGKVLEVGVGSVIHKTLKIVSLTKEQMLVQTSNRIFIMKYGQSLEIFN